MEQFLGSSGFWVYSDSAWCWHLTFRSLLYYLCTYVLLLVSHSLGHWLSFPSVALPLGSLGTGRHWTWLLVPVWVTTSTHTSNILPQLFFFLDSFSFNYVVRSTWFVSCFGLKQKYFLQGSECPTFPTSFPSTSQGSRNFTRPVSWRICFANLQMKKVGGASFFPFWNFLSPWAVSPQALDSPILVALLFCWGSTCCGWLLLLCCLPSLCLRSLTRKGETSSVCLQLTVI